MTSRTQDKQDNTEQDGLRCRWIIYLYILKMRAGRVCSASCVGEALFIGSLPSEGRGTHQHGIWWGFFHLMHRSKSL